MQRKRLLSVFLFFLGLFLLPTLSPAQVRYLVNLYRPEKSLCYTPYKYTGQNSKGLAIRGGLSWQGSFEIGHTVGPYHPGYAVFNLNGEYEHLMFMLGHSEPNGIFGNEDYMGVATEPGIFAVYADGKKILDEKIYPYAVPKRKLLNISGVKKLEFKIVTGYIKVGVGEATLWKKGQTPVETGNLIKGQPKTTELMKDLKSYCMNTYLRPVSPTSEKKSLKINGQTYSYGLSADMDMAIIGTNQGLACFYLRKQYDKLSFVVGPLDDVNNRLGKGWITVKADEKIIYEEEWTTTDIARQVTLDIPGCDMLTFHSEQVEGSLHAGIVDIKVYPKGVEPKKEDGEDATIDPRLKSLPDVCKLMSNIPPYAAGSLTQKQLFTGESDYITFSMGGTRFSEGFVLYQKGSVFNDRTSSYAAFDLGKEFDHISFTAGYIGKSGAMTNDSLFVIADDKLIYATELLATQPNKKVVLPIHKCRRLIFKNKGSGNLEVGAYGVADLVVYRGEPVENDLFYHPVPDCPDSIDLLDLGLPYIHYVSPMKDRQILCDGSTKKNYWEIDGKRIYKGFLLQTSVHFSLDHGPLSSGSANAAAGAIGGAAVGAAFVAGGAAVGGALVGSTLVGAAAFLMLAAGGEAMENSCAAFNTYGMYNSVTFTVDCYQKRIESLTSQHKETLLIGADGKVVAEIALYEYMEPQTITIPIDGCEQLMFWLANTDNWSGQYLFYDIKLSKEKSVLRVPKALRNETVVTRPEWTSKRQSLWERPVRTNVREIDSYMYDLESVYKRIKKLLEYAEPKYEIHTAYLQTESGLVCKAVNLKNTSDNFSFEDASWLRIPYELKGCQEQLKTIDEIRKDIVSLQLSQPSVALALPQLGFAAFSFGKVFKEANRVLSECDELIGRIHEEKAKEASFLDRLCRNAVDLGEKKSTERTIFSPLFEGEEVSPDMIQLLEFYPVK